MISSTVELLNVFLLITSEFLVQIECAESDFIGENYRHYIIPYDVNFSHTQINDDYQTWNSKEGMSFLASIPLISNVVVTGQEPFYQDVTENDSGMFLQKVQLPDELGSESNSTQGNCTVNFSSCEQSMYHRAPTFQQSALTRVIVLLLIAIFSLIGNIATLSSILRTGRQGTSTVYMLLVQLAIADLLVSIFCILSDALWTLSVQWYGGNFLCKAVKFMQLFSLYLSTFLLVLIGFDRLCAVRFPMRRAHAKHHIRTGIVCVWTLSAIFSLPQVFIFSVMRGPFVEDFYQCVTYAFYTAEWQEQLYTTLSLVLMFLLPLLILLTTYIATFLTIANSGRENLFSERVSRSAIDSARQKILRKAKVKSLMITVVIVLTFVVCWTPYYVTMIIFMFLDPSEQLSQDLQKAIFFFGSSTAAINPLIYGAFHLRPRRRRRSKSATSLVNHSSSSRLETYSHVTFRKSHSRTSHKESMDLQVVNGDLLSNTASLYKHRFSCMPNVERRNRVVHQNSVPY